MYDPRLRDLREGKDLTQDALVQILDMHKTTYTNCEQGKREIPFALAVRLAQLYNVTLDYIAGLTNDPEPLHQEKNNNIKAPVSRHEETGALFMDDSFDKAHIRWISPFLLKKASPDS